MKDPRDMLKIAEEIYRDIENVCDNPDEVIYVAGYISGRAFSKGGVDDLDVYPHV